MDLQNQEQAFNTPSPILTEVKPVEEIVEAQDPIALNIPDDKLHKIINKRIRDSRNNFRQKYNLYDRRKENEQFLFGRQINAKEIRREFKIYEARFLDNALYEIEASLKPLAMNKLPDMIVTPGNPSPEAKQSAEEISLIVDADLKKRNNRTVLGIAFKHLPVYFTGVIKAVWNPELGEFGDYEFRVVHPDYVDVDYFCQSNNSDDMDFVSEILPLSVQDVVMRFPTKKEALFKKLKSQGLCMGETDFTQEDLASEIKIREVWFKWYVNADNDVQVSPDDIPMEPGVKFEQVRGVVWKYDDVILKKIKNPNFDYEGQEQIFVYDDPSQESTKREMDDTEKAMAMTMGIMPPSAQTETVYKNYFQMPRVPYFFFGYDQWHKTPMDETSRIEQNLRNQQNLDKNGKIIQEKLANRGKHVFSKEGGLQPEDIERMDLSDPDQDILVEGDVNKVHSYIVPEQPTPQEFQDQESTRNRMYAIAGSNAIRGTIQSDTATSNQIAREADFTRADDLVEDTINAASEWMSQWAMQFIKLRYTAPHMRQLLGQKGVTTFIALKSDMIDNGMEVLIKASGTDKLKAQNNAMEPAKLQLIDPLTFYEDMGLSDPEGRTQKLIAFLNGKLDGYQTYLMKFAGEDQNVTPQLVDKLMGQGTAAGLQGQPPGAPPIPVGQPPVNPQQPTPTNTAAVPAQPPVGIPQASPRGL